MSAFQSERFYPAQLQDLYGVLQAVQKHFQEKDYDVSVESSSFGAFISLSKGGIFKSILGMKTALNVEIRHLPDGIQAEAKVGIWGQQMLPSLIMLFVSWPVLLTQITGLVQQAKLDDEVLQVLGQAIDNCQNAAGSTETEFCVNCGAKIAFGSAYCPVCGGKQE